MLFQNMRLTTDMWGCDSGDAFGISIVPLLLHDLWRSHHTKCLVDLVEDIASYGTP